MSEEMVAKIEPISADDNRNKSDNNNGKKDGTTTMTPQENSTADVDSGTHSTVAVESRMSGIEEAVPRPPDESPPSLEAKKPSSPANRTPVTDMTNSSDDTTDGEGIQMRNMVGGKERPSSPFWSSSEEGSHKVDAASSSSSEDTAELEAALASRSKKKIRVNAPLGGKLSDEEESDAEPGRDGFGDLPDIFFQRGGNGAVHMSHADIEICQRLDFEYERALEEREIGYNARYQSVRQSACFSIFFMLLYLVAGTTFFTQVAGWEIHDALFFSIYTMTTVGYGLQKNIPDQFIFQLFVIFYIFVGIATLTIMVAQVYQCIALEATRAQHARDRAEMARKGQNIMRQSGRFDMMDDVAPSHGERFFDCLVRQYERLKACFRDSDLGRGVSVLFPFAGLIILGAVVVGPIEGWGVVESIYFACVSLTTVGYGLYVPQNPISIYFCIVWLPFSVGFMSLFLGNVASFYIRLSDRNISRLERQMRRRMKRAKEEAERDLKESSQLAMMGTDDPSELGKQEQQNNNNKASQPKGFEMLGDDDDSPLFGTPSADIGEQRRHLILANSNYSLEELVRPDDQTMQTMRDILRTVRYNMTAQPSMDGEDEDGLHSQHTMRSQESQYLSMRSQETIITPTLRRKQSTQRKPTFALRVLVQERFAEIIATDIAGFQSHIEIKENTLSVTIDTLKGTADKWLVPRRARKAFRAVAFEALYFVGEHGLITRGADALYDLSPFEFHGLFSPLLAAMGDAETMEGWLANTDVLADVDLRRDGSRPALSFISGAANNNHHLTESKVQERFASSMKFVDGSGDIKKRTSMGHAFANK